MSEEIKDPMAVFTNVRPVPRLYAVAEKNPHGIIKIILVIAAEKAAILISDIDEAEWLLNCQYGAGLELRPAPRD